MDRVHACPTPPGPCALLGHAEAITPTTYGLGWGRECLRGERRHHYIGNFVVGGSGRLAGYRATFPRSAHEQEQRLYVVGRFRSVASRLSL